MAFLWSASGQFLNLFLFSSFRRRVIEIRTHRFRVRIDMHWNDITRRNIWVANECKPILASIARGFRARVTVATVCMGDRPVDVNSRRPYIFSPAILLPSARPFADVDWKSSPIINNLNALPGSKKRMATRREGHDAGKIDTTRARLFSRRERRPPRSIHSRSCECVRTRVHGFHIYLFIYLRPRFCHQPVLLRHVNPSRRREQNPASFDLSYRYVDYRINVESLNIVARLSFSFTFIRVSSRGFGVESRDQKMTRVPPAVSPAGLLADESSRKKFVTLSEESRHGDEERDNARRDGTGRWGMRGGRNGENAGTVRE